MATEVWIPWRAQPSRERALAHVMEWWERHGYTVCLIDTGHEPFNLAACRNAAVDLATTPVVILADADTLPQPAPMAAAVRLAADGRGTVLPYTEYRSLMAAGSDMVYAGRPHGLASHMVVQDACSGIFVTTKTGWASHHGQDELFAGWGCEDAAWEITHTTLLGPPRRIRGRVYALHHESQDKAGEPTLRNFRRIALYEQAAGDPPRIRHLAGGGS